MLQSSQLSIDTIIKLNQVPKGLGESPRLDFSVTIAVVAKQHLTPLCEIEDFVKKTHLCKLRV